MKFVSTLFLVLFLVSCQTDKKQLTADEIVAKSIEVSGGDKMNTSSYAFEFRGKNYLADRYYGKFSFVREFTQDSVGFIQDYLGNEGFERYINNEQVVLADSTAEKLSASVNSVHYFAVLPHGLDAEAVNKELLGEVKIKDVPFYKIKVTFSEDGGGEDFEDVFVYWINKLTYKVDYLAYSYEEESGIGYRFREAYNERYVGGLRFVDYNNYKPEITTGISVTDLDDLFETDQLALLSKIKLENITEGKR
ncbi:DUF6503 family protein [Bizionia sp. KMM 8389]